MTKPKYRFPDGALIQVKSWLEEGKSYNEMSKIMGAPATSIRCLWERNRDDIATGFYFLSFDEKVKSLHDNGMHINSICAKLHVPKKEVCESLGVEYVKHNYKKPTLYRSHPMLRRIEPKKEETVEYGRFNNLEFVTAGYGDGARDAGKFLAAKGHIITLSPSGKIYIDSSPLRGVGELMQKALGAGWKRDRYDQAK